MSTTPGSVIPPAATIPIYLEDRQPGTLVGSQTNNVLLPGWPETADPKPLRYGEMNVTNSLREGVGLYDNLVSALSALAFNDRKAMDTMKDEARHTALRDMTASLIQGPVAEANVWRAKTLETVRVTLRELQHLTPADNPVDEMRDQEIRHYVSSRPNPEMFLAHCLMERDLITVRAILRGRPYLSNLHDSDLGPAKQSLIAVNIQARLNTDKLYRNPLNSLRALIDGQEALRLLEYRGLESVLTISHAPAQMAQVLRESAWLPDAGLVSLVRELTESSSQLPTLHRLSEEEIGASLAA